MGPKYAQIIKWDPNGPQINGSHLFWAHLGPILLFGPIWGPFGNLLALFWLIFLMRRYGYPSRALSGRCQHASNLAGAKVSWRPRLVVPGRLSLAQRQDRQLPAKIGKVPGGSAPGPPITVVGLRPPWAARSPPNGSQGPKNCFGIMDSRVQRDMDP